MKNLESVESQLRSWAPRQPSPKLKEHLFGAPTALSHREHHRLALHLNWQSAWGIAAATCILFVMTGLNLSRIAGLHAPAVPLSLASLSNVTSLAAAQHNCWSAPIFGWTNARQLHSPKRSFDLLNTNYLLR